MKVFSHVAAMAVFTLTPALAALPVAPNQAMADEGRNVTVRGIARVRPANSPLDGIDIVLEQGPTALHVYIPKEVVQKLPDLAVFDGKKFDVTGVIEMDGGQPEIRVTSPDQLALVGMLPS